MDATAALFGVLHDFNQGEAFFRHLAPTVTFEFPYGPTLGLPARLDGDQAVAAHLRTVQRSGLVLSDITLTPMTSDRYLAEYTGHYRDARGESFPSALVSVIEYRDGRITGLREYWNTKEIAEAAQP